MKYDTEAFHILTRREATAARRQAKRDRALALRREDQAAERRGYDLHYWYGARISWAR